MPNKGGSLANENSFPDKSAKTISNIRMNMVPPGGSAIEPAKNKYTYLKVRLSQNELMKSSISKKMTLKI